MRISEFLNQLTAKGYCCFASAQAKEALNISEVALRATLRRLKQKGGLAQPLQGFYVIVPPEYRILGCRPAEHFINELMEYIGIPYYVGLLSAAQYYGAAHHRPQQFQVVTNQKRRPINCGRIRIVFITKKDIQNVPTQKFNTPQSIVTISTPEATAMDLIIYANRCGGMDNVITVLSDLINKIDPAKLNKLATESKETPWIQRFGYMLDLLNSPLSEVLEQRIKLATHKRELATHRTIKKLERTVKNIDSVVLAYKKAKKPQINKKWKLIINKKLEPDE
jgi:predicted transcriptional regulator of viral defense system